MLNWFNKNIFITRDVLWIRLQRSIFTCCSMTAVTLLKYDDSRPDASSSEGSCGDMDRQITATGGWFYRDKFYTGWFYIGWFYRDHQTLDQFYRNYRLQRPQWLRRFYWDGLWYSHSDPHPADGPAGWRILRVSSRPSWLHHLPQVARVPRTSATCLRVTCRRPTVLGDTEVGQWEIRSYPDIENKALWEPTGHGEVYLRSTGCSGGEGGVWKGDIGVDWPAVERKFRSLQDKQESLNFYGQMTD